MSMITVWQGGALVEKPAELIEPHVPVAPPMPRLSPLQFELMLYQIGLNSAAIEAQIAAMPDAVDRDLALISFRRAIEFKRDHWAVGPLSAALGFSAEEMDTMWRYAAGL